MNRRGFLQALFAVPVLAAPLLAPLKVVGPPKREVLVVTHVDRKAGVITISSLADGETTRAVGGNWCRFQVGDTVKLYVDDGEAIPDKQFARPEGIQHWETT